MTKDRTAPGEYFVSALLFPLALAPATFLLTCALPIEWLRPLCKDTWPVLLACLITVLVRRFLVKPGRYASLLLIAFTQATFQAWCYNTASHPALNPFQLWGILPQTDAQFYYTQACELLHGQQISIAYGTRYSYPAFLATLLSVCHGNLRLVTSLTCLITAIATWAAFEIILRRLQSPAALIYLACITFYIRTHTTGLLMTETVAIPLALCATSLLIEGLWSGNGRRPWLWCGGLLLVTQALNARPAAYLTLLFLLLVTWPLFQRNRKLPLIASTLSIVLSLVWHIVTYERTVAPPRCESNGWYCFYGILNNGTWVDGLNRATAVSGVNNRVAFLYDEQTTVQMVRAIHVLRQECLLDLRQHPIKLLSGCWRAIHFIWNDNTPFRSNYPQMPARWFTETMRWLTIVGLLATILVFARKRSLLTSDDRKLAWLLLAVVAGFVTSLPFAPPWDGGTRVYAATLPLFYLLPAFGSGMGYKSAIDFWRRPKQLDVISNGWEIAFPLTSAIAIASLLTAITDFCPWYFVGLHVSRVEHPVLHTLKALVKGEPRTPIDLRSLPFGYRLRLVDNNHTTALPSVSTSDFIRNLPRGSYLPLSDRFKRLPEGSEVLAYPYWTLFIATESDAMANTFTPEAEQTGHIVWPPVYFSDQLKAGR